MLAASSGARSPASASVSSSRACRTRLRAGGEHLATSTVCSGPNTNPWRAEATGRVLEAGDLVYVDTDAVGVEGYFFCVSRTFLVRRAPRPPPSARRTASLDWLRALRSSSGRGSPAPSSREGAALPEKFLPQRYES